MLLIFILLFDPFQSNFTTDSLSLWYKILQYSSEFVILWMNVYDVYVGREAGRYVYIPTTMLHCWENIHSFSCMYCWLFAKHHCFWLWPNCYSWKGLAENFRLSALDRIAVIFSRLLLKTSCLTADRRSFHFKFFGGWNFLSPQTVVPSLPSSWGSLRYPFDWPVWVHFSLIKIFQ